MSKKSVKSEPIVEQGSTSPQPVVSATVFNTQSNYDYGDTFSTDDPGLSVTVPDQVFSIEEIISRYARNLPVPEGSVVNVDMDVADFARMDKFDKIEMARTLRKRQAVLQKEIDDAGAAELQKRLDAEFDAKVDAKVNERIANTKISDNDN